jgi:3-deoxy-7-phosphoheptulonate synthase
MTDRARDGLPSFAWADDRNEPTSLTTLSGPAQEGPKSDREAVRRPYVLVLAGPLAGVSHRVDDASFAIGRGATCGLQLAGDGVSRIHARILTTPSGFVLEDAGSANGTLVNGERVVERRSLRDGDKIMIGASVLKFALFDQFDERYEHHLRGLRSPSVIPPSHSDWTPEGWKAKPVAQAVAYPDPAALDRALAKLRSLPPLVTSWEIEDLKRQLAEAQERRRFVLQGGDCAELLAECQPGIITNKLKILIQMSLVLVRGARRPVVRIGRFAGQYAKPRSKATEARDGVELPSYFGDLVNRAEFTPEARHPDPQLLLESYYHAALTLNFIRSLGAGGFADLRRPEYFDLSYFERAELPTDLRNDYGRMCREVTDGLNFMHAVGDRANELMKVNFFTSHEGLNLHYESAQTRAVPRREGYYDLTTHMPWVGERTRQLGGAHIDFFRGIQNPVAVKIGPSASPIEVLDLCDALNPMNERGKLVIVTRMGAQRVRAALPPILNAVGRSGRRVLWMCDPMHGNGVTTADGVKTRNFDEILLEIERTMDVHEECQTYLGGVHFELTGEDVTECTGGGLTEADLARNYASTCDPRLNYRQAIQMAFCLSNRLTDSPRAPSTVPPPVSGR